MLVEGTVRLRVTLGAWPVVVNMDIDFLIIDAPNNVYNAILSTMLLNKAKLIISSPLFVNEVPNFEWNRLSLG